MSATIYLTVPNDCKVGVCAHELGHLAFEWQDFYDPNYNDDGTYWDGTGMWDLMASGSYNGNGARPAHPAPLHKLQHGWVKASTITASAKLTMKPYTATGGEIVKVVSPLSRRAILLLENRRRPASILTFRAKVCWSGRSTSPRKNDKINPACDRAGRRQQRPRQPQ